MALIPVLVEMTCYEYFKMLVEENLKLECLYKNEIILDDGWIRSYQIRNYFHTNEIDKELKKISDELNVDLIYNRFRCELSIRKR